MVGLFTSLAIFVACLGLFGLASLTIQRRMKEIGVRKILGASTGRLLVLSTGEFTRVILLAFVGAAPLTYLLMEQWLNHFPYRTGFDFSLLALAGFLAWSMTLLVTGYHAIRAAHADPVKTLKDRV